MKIPKPLFISIIIAILIQIAIIPWAAWQGTLNWQTGPLYLIYTVPTAAFIMVIGVVVSLFRRSAG